MKKNILILSPKFYPSLGGVEEQVSLLGKKFIALGHHVDVYTTKHEDSLGRVEIIECMTVYRLSSVVGLFYLLYKNREKYDLILSRHYYKNSFILSLCKLLKIIKSPTVICADSGGVNDEIIQIQQKRGIFSRVYFWCINKNDYLNCINEDNRNHLYAIYGKVNKITKIYNGIDFGERMYPQRKKIKKILFLARIVEEKGIFETIEAFTMLKDKTLTLTIVGSGSGVDEEKVKTLIQADRRISYLGPLYGSQKERVFSESDLLVFPSYTEGQSVLLLEAVKYNIPVITTDIADNKLLYGDNFLYVEKESSQDLYDKLLFITEGNICQYVYEPIKKKLSIDTTCHQFLVLL